MAQMVKLSRAEARLVQRAANISGEAQS